MKGFPARITREKSDNPNNFYYTLITYDSENCIYTYFYNNDKKLSRYFSPKQIVELKKLKQGEEIELNAVFLFGAWSKSETKRLAKEINRSTIVVPHLS